MVNRQEGSSLNDIRSWGEAILIDVWKFNQGLSKHPVSWTAESPDLSAWAAAGAIKELFSLEELDWDLIQFTS